MGEGGKTWPVKVGEEGKTWPCFHQIYLSRHPRECMAFNSGRLEASMQDIIVA